MVVGEIARPVEVLVVGGGPGGYTAAARAAELGKEVVLVEADRLGGVCLNVGCIPSKALIHVADERHRLRDASARGLLVDDRGVDLAVTQKWKDGVVDTLVAGVESLLRRVEVVTGDARLLDGRRAAVESGEQVAHFQFDHCILATGTEAATLPELPIDDDWVIDSTGALSLTAVPDTMIVVGGGYIGLELGTAYAKLGSRVTVVEALDRIGAGFDADLVRPVIEELEKLGVAVRTSTRVVGAGERTVRLESPDGATQLAADIVLVAVGRRPRSGELQLERAGIDTDDFGRIPVDERCRTASRRIFAIGDLTPGPALAHRAMEQGRVAAEVIAGLPSAFDQKVPAVAFTDPELAQVGMTESEATAAGYEVVVGRARFAAVGRAHTIDRTGGLVKLVADRASQAVLGVGIAGPDASELIGECVLAVETASRLQDLARCIHPHPTLSEALADAALAAQGAASARRD
jgi:dihydrolipoamide dehydrogenase